MSRFLRTSVRPKAAWEKRWEHRVHARLVRPWQREAEIFADWDGCGWDHRSAVAMAYSRPLLRYSGPVDHVEINSAAGQFVVHIREDWWNE